MECPRTPEMRGRAFTSTPPRGPLAPPFQVADETQLSAPINDAAGNPNQAPLGEPAKEAGNQEAPIMTPEEAGQTPSTAAGGRANNDPMPAAQANANAAAPRGAEETRGEPARHDAGRPNKRETLSRRKGDSKPNKVSLDTRTLEKKMKVFFSFQSRKE